MAELTRPTEWVSGDVGLGETEANRLIEAYTQALRSDRDAAVAAAVRRALEDVAAMALPEPPEVSFFGDHGREVALWLRRRAAAVASPAREQGEGGDAR